MHFLNFWAFQDGFSQNKSQEKIKEDENKLCFKFGVNRRSFKQLIDKRKKTKKFKD